MAGGGADLLVGLVVRERLASWPLQALGLEGGAYFEGLQMPLDLPSVLAYLLLHSTPQEPQSSWVPVKESTESQPVAECHLEMFPGL